MFISYLKFLFLIFLSLLSLTSAFANDRIINLNVGYKTVHFAGKAKTAIAVNNQIPAPILHFKEGDTVTINVHNRLDQETAVHWHGLIVPWQMDGVLGISQHGIRPGDTFHYKFKLLQAGTYWYHAHADLQEQQGLYGALIIDPAKHPNYHYTKDYTIVLSDWSNTYPNQVLANLKKDGEYYSPRLPLQPSLMKFIHDYKKASPDERKQLIDDYKMMQQMRMSIYDFSDVAYDAFLLNGHPKTIPWTAPVKVGNVVRLRFIGASGSTIFHVKIPHSTLRLIQAEGNDIQPRTITDFTIAPGETYDVLVNIKQNVPYIIYAESIDTAGAAIGALTTSPNQSIDYKQVTPFPEPLPVTRDMMSMMMGGMKMDHASEMSMPTESQRTNDSLSPPEDTDENSSAAKYQNIVAAIKTNDPNKPVTRIINMELFGYMDRYIWFINGVPGYKAHPIILKPNKRYRFVFTNTSMMHHPMHFHGHWFILRKGNGSYDPLLHTIDVPPGATITADVDTDASGQWFFHCHMLYHMMTGMSRLFQYSTLLEIVNDDTKPQHIEKETIYPNRPIIREDEVRPIAPMLVKHPMGHPAGLWLSTLLDVGVDPFHNAQRLTYKGLYGPDYNKLELFVNDAEISKGQAENADIDIFYWHLLDQFWAVKGGVNYTYRPAKVPYWQPGIGIEGLLPYFIDTDIRGYYYSGSTKLDIELSRDSQITNNFLVKVGIRSILASKSVPRAEIGSGINQMRYIIRPYYRLAPGLNVFAEYEHEHDYGVFNTFQRNSNEPTTQNTITLGLSALF